MIAGWRGEQGKKADITLVWGVPLVPGGAIVTAELANLAVDQSELVEDRFTLIAPDNYRGDYLEIKLWSKGGDELARESLYVEDRRRGLIGESRSAPRALVDPSAPVSAAGSRSFTSASDRGKWQAAMFLVPLCSSSGSSWLQSSCALKQRVWNRQA